MSDILAAITPVLFTFITGYFLSYKNIFDYQYGSMINTVLMKLILPFSIFSSIVSLSISNLVENINLIVIFAVFLSLSYVISILILHYILRLSLESSTLYGLTISTPAVVFIGVKLLEPFVSEHYITAALIATTIVMSFVTTPLTIILLTVATYPKGTNVDYKSIFINSIKEPVVLIPTIGLILVLIRIPIPQVLIDSTHLLGMATSGLSMLSAGIILQASKFEINFKLLVIALIRNLVFPLITLAILLPFNLPNNTINTIVISFGIPVASLTIIMSIQYNTLQKEMSSIFGMSTVGTIITLPILAEILHLAGTL